MADDDKKINLPDIIPEVDRREVLRGGLATLGRAFMGSLPGAISDLTPADIIPTTKVASPMSITAAFSQLLKRSNELSESVEALTNDLGVADGNAMAEAAGDVITGGYTSSFYDAMDRLAEFEADEPNEPWTTHIEDLSYMANEVDDNSHFVEKALKDLKSSFKEEYPDDFVDWLFDTGKGRSIFSEEITNLQYDIQDAEFTEDGHPLQSWKLPTPEYAGMSEGPDIYRELPREELNEDQRNASDYLTDLFIPNILQKAIPEYEKEKKVKIEDIPWEKIPETKKLPNPVKERVKKVAESTAKEGLGRLLNQLAAKKDTGTKQIEGPKESQSSLNKVLNALSIFRRSSPVGAAASVMWPTPTAHDDDYNFQIPVDR
jgi:hypothetical protein